MDEFTTPNPCTVGQLFANPCFIEAPPYQRSFAWTAKEAGRLLDDISRRSSEVEAGEAATISSAPCCSSIVSACPRAPLAGRWRARQPRSRGGRRVAEADHAHHPVLRAARPRRGATASRRTRGCWRRSSGGDGASARPRLTLREPEDDVLPHPRARAGRHAASAAAGRPARQSEAAHPGGARAHRRRAGGLDAARAPTGSPISCSSAATWCYVATTGIDRAHRMFTVLNATGKPLARNDILKAELLGSVARRSDRCVGHAIWDEAEEAVWRTTSRACSATSAPCTGGPDGQVIRRHPRDCSRERRRAGLHRGCARSRLRASSTTSATPGIPGRRIRPRSASTCAISAGTRSPTGCRRPCCGGSKKGKDAGSLAAVPAKLDRLRLRHAHAGHRRREARPPFRRRDLRHPGTAATWMRADSPLAAYAPGAAHHPAQPARPARAQRVDCQASAAAA